MNYTLGLQLTADKSGLSAAVVNASGELRSLGSSGKGAGDQINSGMRNAQTGAERLEKQMGTLKAQSLGFFAASKAVDVLRGAGRMADEYANLSARLKGAIGDSANFASAQQQVFSVAQQTSTSLATTTMLSAKLTKSLQEMGATSASAFTQSLGLATTINQAFAVSGTTAESANAAITQLNQAFSKGVLNGDEYVAVFENAPGIVEALSRSLGKSTAELRAMSEAGQLTSQVIITALQSQAGAISAQYSALPLTIGRAWQQVENSVLQYVGQADQANGASATLAGGLKFVADNFDSIANALVGLAAAGVAVVFARGISSVVEYGQGLLKTAAANSALTEMTQLSAKAKLTDTQAIVTQTQALIVANKVEAERAVALLNTTRLEVLRAQKMELAAKAAGAQSFALKIAEEADLRYSFALAARDTAEQKLQETVATGAELTEQASAASNAVAEAQTGVNEALAEAPGLFENMGDKLLGFVEGPAELASLAITGLAWVWANYANKNSEATDQIIAGIDGQIAALDALIAKNKQALADQGLAATIKLTGIASVDTANQIAELEAKIAKLNETAVVSRDGGVGFLVRKFTELIISSPEEEMAALTTKLDALNTKSAEASRASQLLAAGMSEAEVGSRLFGEAILKAKAAVNGFLGSSQSLSEELNKQTIALGQQALQLSGVDVFEKKVQGQILFKRVIGESTATLEQQLLAYQAAKTSVDAANNANKTFSASVQTVESQVKKTSTALGELKRLAQDLSAGFNGPDKQANERYADQMQRIGDLFREAGASAAALKIATDALTDADRQHTAAMIEVEAAENDKAAAVEASTQTQIAAKEAADNYINTIDDELALMGLSDSQRKIITAGIKAQNEQQEKLNASTAAGNVISEAERQRMLEAARQRGEAVEGQRQVSEAAGQAADEYERKWTAASASVSDAFADFVTGGIKSFSDFGDALKNIARRFISDLISQFAQKNIFGPLLEQFSGAVSSQGGGGGIAGLFSSFFGGGATGGSGGGIGGLISSFFGGGGSSGGGIGGLISSFFGGGGATAGTGGGLSGITGIFSSLLGGGGAAAGSTAAAGAGSAGLYAIPVAGWIAAAIAVSSQLYASGWKPQGGTVNYGNGGSYTGGGLDGTGRTLTALAGGGIGERLFTALGVNNRLASILSGASIFTSLFGRKAPEIRSQGYDLNVGQNSASGGIFANIYEKGGLFRSSRSSVGRTGLTPELQEQADQLSAQASQIVRTALGGLTSTFDQTITGNFHTLQDKTGKVIEEYITVMGVQYKEGLEQLPVRIGAEEIFAGLNTITGQSLETFAAQFRGTADGLLDAAQTAAAAQQLIAQGAGLLRTGDLLTTVNLVNELKNEGESLTAAFARVYAGAQLLQQATQLMGVTFNKSEADFVRFATNVATAAGGLEQAQALWQGYFATFYSETERAALALSNAEQARTTALVALGLSATTSARDFRTAFETALPNLSPEQVVQWLRAGSAIGAATTAQAAYNTTLDAATQATTEARKAQEEALASAISSLSDIESQINDGFTQLERAGLSSFQTGLLQINDALAQNVASLNAQRRAAVLAGASAEQLARFDLALGRAHTLAASQAAAAINQLRDAGRSLVSQLGIGLGAPTNAAQAFADAGTSAFNQIGEAASNVYESQLSALQSIQEWLDAQRLGDLSSLTPSERFDEANAQFIAAFAAAQGGDPEALRRLTGLADALLREGRGRFASSQGFTDLEERIRAALASLVAAGPTATPTTGTGGTQTGGSSGLGDQLGQQTTENRTELLAQLSQIIRDLIAATGGSLSAVAASLSLDLSAFVTQLGGATVETLGNIATQLGIEASEIAEAVGATLGELGDRQSLLNDSVEAAIALLPADQRAQLQPLLDAVEASADDPEGLKVARDALVNRILKIGGEAADALAPFFDEIDPVDALVGIDGVLRAGFSDMLLAIGSVTTAINGVGSFDVGTGYVSRNGLAQIHEGEMIIDPATSAAFRQYGIQVQPVGVSGGDSQGTLDRLERIAGLLDRGFSSVATAVIDRSERQIRSTEGGTDKMLREAEFGRASKRRTAA